MKRYDPQFMHCRVDEDTYLIRFPSCDLTDAEIAGVRAAVAVYCASGCENLVVDIRGNMGGSDNAYEPLLKLLYDHEGTEDAMEYRVSDIAIAHVREFVGNTERGRRKVAYGANPGRGISKRAKPTVSVTIRCRWCPGAPR